MELSAYVDRVLPGPGSALDKVAAKAQDNIRKVTTSPAGARVARLLHGNEWLGHPLHPVVIAVPIGAWSVTGWYDARGALSRQSRRHDAVADAALRVGVAGAVTAAATGLPQFLDTRDGVRRETLVHAALNNTALTLYLASWALRKAGQRSRGRRLATAGLAVVGVSGYLGGDISYRHGVGVRPQVLRDPQLPASETSSAPLEASGALHT